MAGKPDALILRDNGSELSLVGRKSPHDVEKNCIGWLGKKLTTTLISSGLEFHSAISKHRRIYPMSNFIKTPILA